MTQDQIKQTADALWREVYPRTNQNDSQNSGLYQEMYEWLYNGDGEYNDLTALAAEWNEYQSQS